MYVYIHEANRSSLINYISDPWKTQWHPNASLKRNSEKYFLKNSESFFSSKLWEVFSQNSMAPERHSEKTLKVFFLKTLRSISSKLWEGFSQNSEKHFLKTKGTRVPLWKLFPPKMVIFSPRIFFVSATFCGHEHTPCVNPARHGKILPV